MTLFKIPRVAVYLPNPTADRVKFVPEYDFPLFKRAYQGRIADPAANPVRIIPHPKDNRSYHFYWHEVEADDLASLVDVEAGRLRGEFGVRDPEAKDSDTWFDTVYAGDTFEGVVAAALKSAETHEKDTDRADPADKILALCAPLRIDRMLARKLTNIGWSDVEALAGADPAQLAKHVGRVNAAKLVEAASLQIDSMINATPAEQIASAKGAKK